MDAPDKIYLSKLVMAGIESLDKPISDSDVEYIRKDALLEWLKQNKQEMEQDLKGSDGLIKAMIATAISSFQEVIEKIESL